MTSDIEALISERRASLQRLYAEGKPLNADQKAELRAIGITVGDEAAAKEAEEAPAVEDDDATDDSRIAVRAELHKRSCSTQHELAACLQEYYRGAIIGLNISADTVSAWLKGKRLPKGAPPPPSKRGNYFIVSEWVEWFDRYKLSHCVAVSAEDDNLASRARMAELLTKVHREQSAAIDLGIRQERYIETATVNRMCLGVAQWVSVNHAQVEGIPAELDRQLSDCGIGETHRAAAVEWLTHRLTQFNTQWIESARQHLKDMAKEIEAEAKALSAAK